MPAVAPASHVGSGDAEQEMAGAEDYGSALFDMRGRTCPGAAAAGCVTCGAATRLTPALPPPANVDTLLSLVVVTPPSIVSWLPCPYG